jgi:hypothetical protein
MDDINGQHMIIKAPPGELKSTCIPESVWGGGGGFARLFIIQYHFTWLGNSITLVINCLSKIRWELRNNTFFLLCYKMLPSIISDRNTSLKHRFQR